MSESFGLEHEYINVLFPGHNTPEGRRIGGERFLQAKRSTPTSTFLKVTDTATDEIIGAACWAVYNGVVPPDIGLGTTEFWDCEEEAEYAEELQRNYLQDRIKAVRESEGHLVCKFGDSFGFSLKEAFVASSSHHNHKPAPKAVPDARTLILDDC